jgi:hypothetical protein
MTLLERQTELAAVREALQGPLSAERIAELKRIEDKLCVAIKDLKMCRNSGLSTPNSEPY